MSVTEGKSQETQVLQSMIEYFDGDVRRINHALKVYSLAKVIGEAEGLNESELSILKYAAILHDIGIKEAERKYGSCAGSYQEQEGPPIAEAILKEHSLEGKTIERACFLIGNHHSYSKVDGVDFQILIEADFLVNIFEENLTTDAIRGIKEKIFRTSHGLMLLKSMYSV